MKKNYLSLLGPFLKELRTSRKLTQQQLADVVGVDRNYLFYLEKGLSDPTLGVLLGLATGFGLSFSELAKQIEDTITKNI